MNKQQVVVNGVQFNSIKDACIYFNVRYNIVKFRMKSTGETLEKVINYYIQYGVKQKSKPVTVNGKRFDSITDACKYFNLNQRTVKGRIHFTGETLEQVINYYIQHGVRQCSQPVTVNDKQFDSLTEACRKFGLKCETVRARMMSTGETPEQVINYYLKNGIRQNSQPVVVNGKHFDSIRCACRQIGLKCETVRARIASTGETPEQAINYYLQNGTRQNSQPVVVNSKQFNSLKDACKFFSIAYSEIHYRIISTGETPEQAINYCIQHGVKQKSQPIVISGRQYKSIKDMRDELSICGSHGVDKVLESLISQGYIQQLDGSFLKIR